MLEKISHWLSGYVQFEFIGDNSRFMNLAARSGIMLWGFEKKENKFYASVKAREYIRLWPLAFRCHAKMKIVRKRGYPFYANLAIKRKGMLIGAVLFLVIYGFLSSFYWDVKINGNDMITDAQISEVAKKCGIFEGAKKDNFEPHAAAQRLLGEIEGLSWVSVNTGGCMVEIEVKEAIPKPEIANNDEPQNIIASREGRILEIIADKGIVQVSPNDVVVKGDLLVSGVYTDNIDPYGSKKAPLKTKLVSAEAEIIAETSRCFEVEISRNKAVITDTGEKANLYFAFFGFKIPLGLNTTPVGNFRSYNSENMLELLNREMPVGLLRERYVYYEEKIEVLSEEDMRKEAVYALRAKQAEILPEDSAVLSEDLEFTITEEGCILVANCICRENIAQKKPVLAEITVEE